MLVGGAVNAPQLNGFCIGKKSVWDPEAPTTKIVYWKSMEKYRFQDGKIFHQYDGRKEYKYNKIEVSPFNTNHFISGHMKFIFGNNSTAYVIVADEVTWKIIFLDCAVSR